MAKTNFQTIDEYIATFPKQTQEILQVIRETIKAAVPGAKEVISYQIPALKLGDNWIFYFSAYAKHYSLSCPPPFDVYEIFKEQLSKYKKSKSTVQFPLDSPVPVKLITDMAKFRAKNI